MVDPLTPNIGLDLVPATSSNWAQKMNDNLVLLDAVVGSYFSVNQLQGIWRNRTQYEIDDAVVDVVSGVVYKCLVAHISASAPITFSEDRVANPSYWGGYASPARARGVWIQDTSYTINDFVVSGMQYAICVQNNISGSTFSADVALGYWSVLIDLSTIGSSTLPSLGGIADATKFVITDPAGVGYSIYNVIEALTFLGATTVGEQLFKANSAGAALAAIGGQPAGSYQPLSGSLSQLSGFVIGAFADEILASSDAASARSILGLSVLATTVPVNTQMVEFLTGGTSLRLLNALSTKTGTGLAVFATSPTFLGTPVAPTAAAGTNTTQVATTAFVKGEVGQRARGYFNSSGTIIKATGMSNATHTGTGTYTLNFSPAMPDANYTVHVTPESSLQVVYAGVDTSVPRSTTQCGIYISGEITTPVNAPFNITVEA